jgi:hypothetical protein
MEVVLILIAVGIIGYVIYQTLPNQKFQKATALFDLGKLDETTKILNDIFEKHPDAPAKLAECKLKEGLNAKSKSDNEAIKYFNEAIEIKKRLPANASKFKYELVEAKACFEIAVIQFSNSNSVTHIESKVKSLKENLRYIETATKSDIEQDFAVLSKKHFSELALINFSFGIQSEKSNKLVEAIQHYSAAKDFAKQSSNSSIIYSSSTRIGISKLKNCEHIDSNIFDDINKSSIEYKRDFFFRYAKKLLQEKDYLETEKVISKHLNFSSSAIDKLKEILKTYKVKDAIEKVNEINNDLDQLYENSFPVEDVKNLYENLDKRIDEIESVIPKLTDKLKQLKPSLFNRLLTHYILEEQYGNAIALIQKYPSFWESPELLKNLGICCYGYTAQGNISQKNYQSIISNWLTAVYSDKVVLKSLEETNWDDDYTFTLTDSIGSNYQQHGSLPDNVNYDDITDSNISIGATQRELLQQFETLMHEKISDNSLARTVTDFYEGEKEAVQKVVSVINTEVLFAAPFFAMTHGINNEIIAELDNDYEEYSNEEALQAGVAYIKNKSESSVGKYSAAKELVSKLLSAIHNENLSDVKAVVADKQKSLIEEFETIKDSVEDSIYNAFALKIEEDEEDEDLIPLMNECIRLTTQNEKLKYQYSSYVADLCISKVNADKINNFKALNLMKDAYMHSKDNTRICKNIITLIRYNLSDYLNDECNNVNEMFSTIDIIRQNKSKTFSENNMELRNELKKIDDSLKTQGSSIVILSSKNITELSSHGIKLKFIVQKYLDIIK